MNQESSQIEKIINRLNWSDNSDNIAPMTSEFWSIWQSEDHRPKIESMGITVIKVKGKTVVYRK